MSADGRTDRYDDVNGRFPPHADAPSKIHDIVVPCLRRRVVGF
jgi:hypothetical protein